MHFEIVTYCYIDTRRAKSDEFNINPNYKMFIHRHF